MKILQGTKDRLEAYVEISDGRLFPLFIDRALEVVTTQTEQEFLDSWQPYLPSTTATPKLVQEEYGFQYVTPETVLQP